jgi:hypothetical protein
MLDNKIAFSVSVTTEFVFIQYKPIQYKLFRTQPSGFASIFNQGIKDEPCPPTLPRKAASPANLAQYT